MTYTIAEEYTLPSLGKVYKQNVNPHIKLRSMTTAEEMKRLSPSEREYKNICDIIDDCLVEKPGISSYDMCVADYQFLLHKLRVVTYGEEYPVISKCPFCYTQNEIVVKLNDLEITTCPDDYEKYMQFKLPRTGKEIKTRFQTPRLIDDVNIRVKEFKKKSKNQSLDNSLTYTVQSLIDTIDGEKLDAVMLEQFVRGLPMMDTNYIIQHAEKLVESFGLKTTMELDCPACGLTYNSNFRITTEFFRPSIHI